MLQQLPEFRGELSKRTMRQQFADRLSQMIRSGLLRPGDELPSERELAHVLDVSRETVRGAIQILAAVGMVEISQGARTRVVRADGVLDASLLKESSRTSSYSADIVYQARQVVELAAARLAAVHIEDRDLARLHRLLDAQAEMTHDPVRFQVSDAEFHRIIYCASRNPLLAEYVGETYSHALEHRRRALLIPGAVLRSWEDHKLILAGLDARDPEGVAAAMQRHHYRVHETTLQVMASDPMHSPLAKQLPANLHQVEPS